MEQMTPAKMKVTELRAELETRGLSSKGLKKDLVARLEAAMQPAAAAANETPSKGASPQPLIAAAPDGRPMAASPCLNATAFLSPLMDLAVDDDADCCLFAPCDEAAADRTRFCPDADDGGWLHPTNNTGFLLSANVDAAGSMPQQRPSPPVSFTPPSAAAAASGPSAVQMLAMDAGESFYMAHSDTPLGLGVSLQELRREQDDLLEAAWTEALLAPAETPVPAKPLLPKAKKEQQPHAHDHHHHHSEPQETQQPASGKKRAQVKSACVHCRKACKKCEEQRPCQRCVRLNMADSCVSHVRKPRERGMKRGPYRKQGHGDDGEQFWEDDEQQQQQQYQQQLEQAVAGSRAVFGGFSAAGFAEAAGAVDGVFNASTGGEYSSDSSDLWSPPSSSSPVHQSSRAVPVVVQNQQAVVVAAVAPPSDQPAESFKLLEDFDWAESSDDAPDGELLIGGADSGFADYLAERQQLGALLFAADHL